MHREHRDRRRHRALLHRRRRADTAESHSGRRLADSCNCAFIQLGMETGGQRIIEMAEVHGAGRRRLSSAQRKHRIICPRECRKSAVSRISVHRARARFSATPLQITSADELRRLRRHPPAAEDSHAGDRAGSDESTDVCPDILRGSAEQNAGRQNESPVGEETAASLLSMMRDTVRSRVPRRVHLRIYRGASGRQDGFCAQSVHVGPAP